MFSSKFLRNILFPTILLTSSPSWAAVIADIDRVVAIVNTDVITQIELNQKVKTVSDNLREKGTQLPPRNVIERQVLERMILQLLQLQLADQTGVRVSETELSAGLQKIASRNKLKLSEFRKLLVTDGFNWSQFREELRNQLILRRLRQREVEHRISVTDREIDNFIANMEHRGIVAQEYHLNHILIGIPEAASPEEIDKSLQTAKKVHELLLGGEDFQQMAVAHSNGPKALEGGDLGWRKASEIPSIFTELVTELETGEFSDLVRSPSGYHILRLVDKRQRGQTMVEQTLVRHILLNVNNEVSETEARLRLEQIKGRIENGEDFKLLAQAHSDDAKSAIKGGDLGWSNPGELVPQFEQQMNSIDLLAISEPFKSAFGWHILQVLDRRQHDSTTEVQRTRATMAIRERKVEEQHQTWLRRLRDEAFVDLRLDE